MSTKNEIRRNITKGDIILIVSILVLSIIWFVFSFTAEENLRAEIYVDGEKAHSIALSEVEESYSIRENYCELLIEKDGVSFSFSNCADQLCVRRGKLKRHGDTMACVPEKIVVIIKSDKQNKIDGVAY